MHCTDWDKRLHFALWAYRIVHKVTTNATPFKLVYGQEAIIPIKLKLQSLTVAAQLKMPLEQSLKERMMVLNEMDEIRLLAFQTREAIQKHRKEWYDHHSRDEKKAFQQGDLVLLYDSRYRKHLGKLKMHWMGPYRVVQVFNNGFVQLANLQGELLPTRVNGARLKQYHLTSIQ